MVAFGATISAFWIIVANSWQQTPAGYVVRGDRAELTSFVDAVFNPSTMVRYLHTVDAALITGAFFVCGISAYLPLKNKDTVLAKRAMSIGVLMGLITSVLELAPFGHEHAKQVARTQPEKFAAIEGLYTSQTGAPIVLFAIPSPTPPELKATLEIPGVLSWLAFGDVNAPIKGINDFPSENIPPLWLTFVSFHNMVVLGAYFILLMLVVSVQLLRDKLWENRLLLKILIWSIPLPLVACKLGWIAAEVGRQPWIVYGLLRTSQAHSAMVTSGEILFSIVLFGLIYLLLFTLYLFLVVREVKRGPQPEHA